MPRASFSLSTDCGSVYAMGQCLSGATLRAPRWTVVEKCARDGIDGWHNEFHSFTTQPRFTSGDTIVDHSVFLFWMVDSEGAVTTAPIAAVPLP